MSAMETNAEEQNAILQRVLEETASVLRDIARLLDGTAAALPEEDA